VRRMCLNFSTIYVPKASLHLSQATEQIAVDNCPLECVHDARPTSDRLEITTVLSDADTICCATAKAGLVSSFRIQFERKRAEVVKSHDLKWERESIGMLITDLHLHELPTELLHAVMVLSDVLNRVVHGWRFRLEEAQRTLEAGNPRLAELIV
jgi:hypothetical protein